MFLLDNNVVREDWNKAKGIPTGILEKHGASITTSRRWAERSLAYTIQKSNRGTYLLVHFDADPGSIQIMRRDLELNETVMRYLILSTEEIPEGEQELHEAELTAEFSVPEPPEDHVVDSDAGEETGDLDIDGVSYDGEYSSKPAPKEADKAAESTEAKAEGSTEAKAEVSTEAKAEGSTEAKAEETKEEAPAEAVTESKEETTEAPASEEA
jgi:small subunit ribosomal protein S6